MARLPVHTVETAPEAAKPRVEAALKANGFIPNLIGVLANAPEALAFYQEVGKLNAANSLTPGEVEVVQIIAAKTNECGFCVAGHTKIATLKKLLSEKAIQASRHLNPAEFDDAKLAALAAFTQAEPAAEAAFEPIGGGKYLANIYLLATQTLRRAGVSQIYGGRHCTVLERDRFFSYRRDGQTGRMVSAVWLSPE